MSNDTCPSCVYKDKIIDNLKSEIYIKDSVLEEVMERATEHRMRDVAFIIDPENKEFENTDEDDDEV